MLNLDEPVLYSISCFYTRKNTQMITQKFYFFSSIFLKFLINYYFIQPQFETQLKKSQTIDIKIFQTPTFLYFCNKTRGKNRKFQKKKSNNKIIAILIIIMDFTVRSIEKKKKWQKLILQKLPFYSISKFGGKSPAKIGIICIISQNWDSLFLLNQLLSTIQKNYKPY
eukprot:TRINITY_DN30672_c0_g3_i1.p1 TRINITY_DN30672_c0_g3~~TRINITY_DN30672_c0_g3_i1.p1  ORF type:complete len:168 (+),score=3.69 TRINITY_DN30672_c0_g3_i1:177-680(+)